MSESLHPLLVEQASPLKHSGQVWRERLAPEQHELVRRMVSLLNTVSSAWSFDAAGRWLAGEPSLPLLYPWSFSPADVIVQGASYWGYDSYGKPLFGEPTLGDLSRKRAYLTLDGRIIETLEGDASSVPASVELSPQTVWFIPRPAEMQPTALIGASETLYEGTGFVCAGNWIMLYRSPISLWPSFKAVSLSTRVTPSWKSTTLRASALFTSGKELALYRRNCQSLRQFERALCELAGLKLLEKPGTILRLEQGNNKTVHWLDDGRYFYLPGVSPYSEGASVSAGDGHILRLRHESLQGAAWWQGRYWGSLGIPIHVFRPGFYGFTLRDEVVGATLGAEEYVPFSITYGGDPLTYSGSPISYGGGTWQLPEAVEGYYGRLILNQNEEAEDLYWSWQAEQERRLGVETFALEILGLSPETPSRPVNALAVFAGVYGTWLAVLETSLDEVDPRAFRELRDYIERERPAGLQVFVAGTGESYTDEENYQTYVNTGTLVEPSGPRPVFPPGY